MFPRIGVTLAYRQAASNGNSCVEPQRPSENRSGGRGDCVGQTLFGQAENNPIMPTRQKQPLRHVFILVDGCLELEFSSAILFTRIQWVDLYCLVRIAPDEETSHFGRTASAFGDYHQLKNAGSVVQFVCALCKHGLVCRKS